MRILFFLLAFALHADELQVDPNGYFSIAVPSVMLPCTLEVGTLACPSNEPVLTIQTQDAPPGAHVGLMALNAEDSIRSKPGFKMIKKETVAIDGNTAIVQTMTFNNLSNVTLPVMVRTIDAVLGAKTFELEVACNQSTCAELMGAFDQAINSLHLAQNGQKLMKAKASTGIDGLLGNFKF